MSDSSFGARLREARKTAGLTQEALGATLTPPLSKSGIYKLEKGIHAISASQALQLAKALGIEAASLSNDVAIADIPKTQTQAINIAEADFADAFLPLVRKIAGEQSAKDVKPKEIKQLASAAQATLREWKGELASDLTSHLAQFLFGSVVVHAARAGREIATDQATRLSRQAASYLMELSADGHGGDRGDDRKSG